MTLLLLVLGGFIAGLIGALLGVGGGVVLVPLLHLGFEVPLPVAIGTSLVVITGTSLAGSLGYLRRGLVDLELAVTLEVGALAGALLASRWADRVPERLLTWIFAAVLLFVGLRLLAPRRRDREKISSPARKRLAILASPLAGAASGLLGVGGGLVQVPLLRLGCGLDMRRAVATSTLMVGWTAAISAAAYWRRGEVDVEKIPWLLVAILCGAFLAPRLGDHLRHRWLEASFAALLLWAAARMVW